MLIKDQSKRELIMSIRKNRLKNLQEKYQNPMDDNREKRLKIRKNRLEKLQKLYNISSF